jgi:hypothetical protein
MVGYGPDETGSITGRGRRNVRIDSGTHPTSCPTLPPTAHGVHPNSHSLPRLISGPALPPPHVLNKSKGTSPYVAHNVHVKAALERLVVLQTCCWKACHFEHHVLLWLLLATFWRYSWRHGNESIPPSPVSPRTYANMDINMKSDKLILCKKYATDFTN